MSLCWRVVLGVRRAKQPDLASSVKPQSRSRRSGTLHRWAAAWAPIQRWIWYRRWPSKRSDHRPRG